MNQQQSTFSRRIRQALEARARSGVPEHVDLWPRLQRTFADHNGVSPGEISVLRSGRRIIFVAAVCIALLTSGVAAAAASPSLRHFVQETVFGIPAGHAGAGTDAHGQPFQIQPLPPFALLYPTSQTEGLWIRGIGQLHPRYGADGFGTGSFLSWSTHRVS